MKKLPHLLSIALLIFGARTAGALSLPHVFSDHMVLQAGQPVPVWGWGSPGEAVTVQFAGQEKHTTAEAGDGHWMVKLDPLAVSADPAQMTVTGSNTVTFGDVLVGEVWLCSGQSNMAKPLGPHPGQKPTFNYEQELQLANYPEIRLLNVPRGKAEAPANDFVGGWVQCTGSALNQEDFSAAGYFFGRKLFLKLFEPIGLIDSSYGGTRIELWLSPKGFAGIPSLREYAKASQTPKTMVDETEVSTCYRAQITPLIPYAIRGVIWYQGESNIMPHGAPLYADKMKALIKGWRADWGSELPFYYVQVAPLLYHVVRSYQIVSPEAEPLLWEQQTACLRIPHTGMIVTTDLVDDLTDIHPRDKKDVGERLANWALADEYGQKNVEVSGPLYHSMEIKGSQVTVHFDHTAGGLVSRDGKTLTWFDVAGADGLFYPAVAAIQGDTVVLSSPKVPEPETVHFAWDEAAMPNLMNKAGLPAVPFRTDSPFGAISVAGAGGD
jgi:sialate O-acetylesterase